MVLTLRKESNGWWIVGVPQYYADGEGPFDSCGPYATKAEAADARSAILQFFREEMTGDTNAQ